MKNIGEQFEHIFMLTSFSDLLPEEVIKNEQLLGQLDSLFAKTEFGDFDSFAKSKFANSAFKRMKASNLDLVLEKHCEDEPVEPTNNHTISYDQRHNTLLSLDLNPHSAVILLDTYKTEYSVVADTTLNFVSFASNNKESGTTYRTDYVQKEDGIWLTNYKNGEIHSFIEPTD